MSKHILAPWIADGVYIRSDIHYLTIAKTYGTERALSNAERIVACVNACEGIDKPEQMLKLAKAHRDACMDWEQTMFKITGEDSPSSVAAYISTLQAEHQRLTNSTLLLTHVIERAKAAANLIISINKKGIVADICKQVIKRINAATNV